MNNISLSIKEKVIIALTGIALPLITVRLELSSISVSMFMACLGLLVIINIKSVTKNIAIDKSYIFIALFFGAATVISVNMDQYKKIDELKNKVEKLENSIILK